MSLYADIALDNTGTYTALCEIPTGYYDPPMDLAGKTVLDIGATCGEVSIYYIRRFHAAHAVCIECSPLPLPYLTQNSRLVNLTIVPEPFKLEHLTQYKADFIKCDVEGYEMVLLEYVAKGGVLPPTVVEVHTNWIREQFQRAGFKVTQTINDTSVQIAVYIMTNYEKLGYVKQK